VEHFDFTNSNANAELLPATFNPQNMAIYKPGILEQLRVIESMPASSVRIVVI
jgi:hypothetical protein